MKQMLSRISRIISKQVLSKYAALLTGLFCAWYFYAKGFRDSPDSSQYLLAADSFSQGLFERNANFAPLYSWCLGLLKMPGLNYNQALFVYLSVIFTGFVWLSTTILKSFLMALLFLVAVLFNAPTYQGFHMIWTEAGYSLLVFSSTVFLLEMLENNNAHVFLFVLSVSLLPLQRYIGGYLAIYIGIVYIFLDFDRERLVKRIKLMALSSIPTVMVCTSNVFLVGGATGSRDPARYGFTENVFFLFDVLKRFFAYESGLLISAIIVAGILVIKNKLNPRYFLILLIPCIQLIAQLHSSSVYLFDKINARFIIVIIPVLYLLLFASVFRFLDQVNFTNSQSYRLKRFASVTLIVLITIGSCLVKEKKNLVWLYNAEDVRQFENIKDQMSLISANSRIAVYSAPIQAASPWILLPRIIPDNFCQRYAQTSSIFDDHLNYISTCRKKNGPSFITVDGPQDKGVLKTTDYFMIFKSGKVDGAWSTWLGSLQDYETVIDTKQVILMKRKHEQNDS